MNVDEETGLYQDRAEWYFQAGRYAEAIILYRKLMEMHPDRESYILALAWAYLDNGQRPEAIECFESLLEREMARNVYSGFAFDELVRIYKSERRFDRLIEICERIAKAQPDDVALLIDLGDAYLRAGNPYRAAVVFRRMIALEPDAPVYHCLLGNALLASGDFDGAEQAYERAAEIDPADTAALLDRMAGEFLTAGEYERAERALRKCLALVPDDVLYRLRLGDVMILEGKIDAATAIYETVIATQGASAGIYYNRLGNTLAKAHRHPEAIAAFRKAIEREPENPFYHRHLAASYLAIGKTDQAEEALAKAGTDKKT
ncbi:MAG: tetratricopeptide repeat protein [Deltaproteobacteria bacterium]|nr:tetratricopeptide repeat protein [Deltaproteobacteria bacterium]